MLNLDLLAMTHWRALATSDWLFWRRATIFAPGAMPE
jgi:hypothetical protein